MGRLTCLLGCVLVLAMSAWGGVSVLSGDFWKPDAAIWGDGRPAPAPSVAEPPHGFKLDWHITVPQTGWYELLLVGAGEDYHYDLLLDGKPLAYDHSTDKPDANGAAKAGNYWLPAGSHVLRIQRVGRSSYPKRVFKRFELRPADGRAEACVSAAKTLVDVMRTGETLDIRVTGGGSGQAAAYTLFSTDLMTAGTPPVQVATVEFPASAAPVTKAVKIPCPAEGPFRLTARSATRALTASEFPIGEYAVVNVKSAPTVNSSEPILVHEIDCVAQTMDGKPLPPGIFLECNGPTRVRTSRAGSYRESHDSTPPEAEKPLMAGDPHSYSGFSYRLSLPVRQVPYLIELTFPDDDRRSTTININWLDEKTGGFAPGTSYSAKSYETGGLHPLSLAMRTHRTVVWAASQSMILGVLNQQFGHRAAVAKIRISRFVNDELPITRANTAGRTFMHWYEEGENWRFLVNVASAYPSGIVHDFV
ncbi:MAG TPA: hypothetical protein VGM23_16540, partial [Armatimonadota bacterium]